MKKSREYSLCKKGEITSWDEGMPLGNGQCGCLIWGNSDHLRFSLDRGDLWDETPAKETVLPEFSFQTLVDYVKEGKHKEIREIFDQPYYQAAPTKIPAGKLILEFQEKGSLLFNLNLQTAEVCICDEEGNMKIRSILHAEDKIGVIEISGENQPQHTLLNPEFGRVGETQCEEEKERKISHGNLKRLRYPQAETGKRDGLEWFFQETKDFTYGIIAGCRRRFRETLLIYKIISSRDGEDWREQAERQIKSCLEKEYDELAAGHRKWWKTYWDKSAVNLPDPLFEKNWYISNYLFASCSRKGNLPMPLQGVWTADDGELPPWKGDYHNDLNTQLIYSHYLKANHLEEGECFLDYLWKMRPVAEKFAETFYHTKGICLPAVMSAGGQALGGWPMYALMPANQLWLGQLFVKHYEYTGEKQFLEERAYPYLRDSYLCIQGLLNVDECGKYRLPVSSSPEIHDDEPESWVTPNSNYDLALMRYAVEKLMVFSEILGNGETKFWTEEMEKMPLLAVSKEGVLMLSPDELLKESHRHHSHAMSIYPLEQLDIDREEDKRIIDATILDLEKLGTGYWVGFSFTWMALLYSRQKNGNGAARCLETFWRYFCAGNGFHLNGDFRDGGVTSFHYRPFTLEANMSAADAVQEMILQTRRRRILLFPAIPDEWKSREISFENFRGENGILISAVYREGKVRELVLKTKYAGTWEIDWEYGEPFWLDGVEAKKTQYGYRVSLQAETTYKWNSDTDERP